MGLQFLGQQYRPGDVMPEPVLKDDSDKLPVEVVKSVRAWLRQSFPQWQRRFEEEGPTPIFVQLGRGGDGSVEYCVGQGIGETGHLFRHQTCEIPFFAKTGGQPLVMTFHYVCARDQYGNVILGDRLVRRRTAQEVLCALT